jgi:hypothetical protein
VIFSQLDEKPLRAAFQRTSAHLGRFRSAVVADDCYEWVSIMVSPNVILAARRFALIYDLNLFTHCNLSDPVAGRTPWKWIAMMIAI